MFGGPPEPPEPVPGTDLYWRAFHDLQFDRQIVPLSVPLPGGGLAIRAVPQRIPFGAIDGYARRAGIEGTDFDVLIRLVGEMDEEYLEQAGKRG